MSRISSRIVKLHAPFLSMLPRLQLHGRIYFRHLRCPHQREELIAEMTALAWKWSLRLVELDKDPTHFCSAIATFAAKAAKSGRQLCGQQPAKDVMSRLAQQRHDFSVSRLPTFDAAFDQLAEALIDNTQSPVLDQVAFRLDFPRWMKRHCQRNRRIAQEMAMGHHTQELARKHRITLSRISQLRSEFHADWLKFCGEAS